MAKARNPTSIEAEKLYKAKGMKLADIAEKLGVPASTVRRWKSTQNWDGYNKNNETERSPKKANVQKEKPNARKKTGAPARNKNAVKHGAYSSVFLDTLDPEEKKIMDLVPDDEETLLSEQIKIYTVRERRIMQAINKYRTGKEPVAVESVTRTEIKRAFQNEDEKQEYQEKRREQIDNGERLPGEAYQIETTTENKDNIISRLERELSTVQAHKTKAIATLAKIRIAKSKDAREADLQDLRRELLDAQIEHTDAATNKLLGTGTELEDLDAVDDLIYGNMDSSGGSADES